MAAAVWSLWASASGHNGDGAASDGGYVESGLSGGVEVSKHWGSPTSDGIANMPRLPMHVLARHTGFAAIFLGLYMATAWAGLAVAGDDGVSPWWLPSALCFWLIVRRGGRWFPLALAAKMVFALTLWQLPLELSTLYAQLVNQLAYLVPALWARRVLGRTPSVHDPVTLTRLLVAGAAGAGIAATSGSFLLVLQDVVDASAFTETALLWWSGDAVGVVCLLPVLAAVTQRLEAETLTLPRGAVAFVIAFSGVVAIPLTAAAVSEHPSRLVFLFFLPVAWIALRHGLVAGSVAALCSNTAATFVFASTGLQAVGLGWVQLLFVTMTLMAAFIGAVADHSAAARDELESRVEQRTADLEQANDALRHAAFHDPLTGLANRALFTDRVEHGLALHARELRPLAVVFCDLDDFKMVNDSFGHAVGDTVLAEVARRLQSCVRGGDTLARLGGDEFAILVEGDVDGVHALARRIIAAVSPPVVAGRSSAPTAVSVGIAVVDGSAPTPDAPQLLARADLAMYAAKSAGRNRCVEWDAEIHALDADAALLRSDLANAVTSGEIGVAYQPICSLSSGEVVQVEALARWERRGHGSVPPATFIPVAVDTGLLAPLSDTVLETALRDLPALAAQHDNDRLEVAVNLAPEQLIDRTLVERIVRLLAASGIEPSRLTLEITEERLVLDPEGIALSNLHALRAAGIALALDDFGTGYSGLSALHALPLTSVKIDRVFVADPDPERRRQFLRAIITLTRCLGLVAVAEGIETEEDLDVVHALGCDHAQGYLLGRPSLLRRPALIPPPRAGELAATAGAQERRLL
jgi:diguanylate cyclase (GGDEF)-like protein